MKIMKQRKEGRKEGRKEETVRNALGMVYVGSALPLLQATGPWSILLPFLGVFLGGGF